MATFCSIARGALWAALVLWLMIVLGLWFKMDSEDSAVRRAANSSQTATLLIAGYAVARAITSIVDEGERAFREATKM